MAVQQNKNALPNANLRTSTPAATSAATGTTGTSVTGLINSNYDAQAEANRAKISADYDRNISNAQADRQKISPLYQTQANDLATQYERNRRNNNLQASANGLNTGTASQMQLAQQSAWQRDYGSLREEEASALTEADRNIANLQAQRDSELRASDANINAQRNAALIDQSNREQEMDLNRAQTLAGYGDFSGFEQLYGKDAADNMAKVWEAQNPDLAYNLGRIDEQRYRAITGKWPVGYSAPGGGGGQGQKPDFSAWVIGQVNKGTSAEKINGTIVTAVSKGLISPEEGRSLLVNTPLNESDRSWT